MSKLFFLFARFDSMKNDVKLTSHSSISLVDDWCMTMMSKKREKVS